VSAWDSSGYSGFLPQSKDVLVRLIGHAKLPLGIRGISRVNMWDYRDRTLVELLSVQAQWVEWPPSAVLGFCETWCHSICKGIVVGERVMYYHSSFLV